MALPSQVARPVARRTVMYRRSRRRRRPRALLAFIVLIAGAFALWYLVFRTPPDNSAPLDPTEQDRLALAPQQDSTPSQPLYAPRRQLPTQPTDTKALLPPRHADQAATEPPTGQVEMGARLLPPHEDLRPADPPPSSLLPPPAADPTLDDPQAVQRVSRGLELISTNRPVQARRTLTAALLTHSLDEPTAAMTRQTLTDLNQRLVFSPEIVQGDPFVLAYIVQPNDALSRIPRKLGIQVDWRFIQRINKISRPERIRPDQRLKIITGPFHTVIHKSDYRLDLFLGDGPDRVYVRSFPVGLGEYNSTPVGRFRVREHSKLINPEWVNPRTGQRFLPDDPDNPIGEHWIGLAADDEHLQGVTGYGVHGTIDPQSIGHQSSMGCVRMLPDDVALLWELLAEDVSTVEIRP